MPSLGLEAAKVDFDTLAPLSWAVAKPALSRRRANIVFDRGLLRPWNAAA